MKLSNNQQCLMHLIRKGANAEGWAPVSPPVLPLVKQIPTDLAVVEDLDEGNGRARLTPRGDAVLDYL